MDASSVAHAWANQAQDEARVPGNGNFYFDGKTIYSYGRHFPIAKHVENAKGEKAVLFTTRRYSNTTSKHISIVRSASNHLNKIYCYSPDNSHEGNFERFQKEIEAIAPALTVARKPEKYLNEIDQVSDKVKKYAEFFDLTIPETLQAAMNISSKEGYLGYAEKKRIAAEAKRKREEKEYRKKHKEELTKWLSGELPYLYLRDGQDYLRIKDGRIQTSQRVELPIELGKRLYQQVKENLLKVGDKVLQFEVNEVGALYRIGCHTFTRKYLLQFGATL